MDRHQFDRKNDKDHRRKGLQSKETVKLRNLIFTIKQVTKLTEYCFSIDSAQLILSIQNINEARFSKPVRSDPNTRDQNLWCDLHDLMKIGSGSTDIIRKR